MTNRLTRIAFDPDRNLGQELQCTIQMMRNRLESGVPLSAEEYLVQLPREKFERICHLALEGLQYRNKESDNA